MIPFGGIAIAEALLFYLIGRYVSEKHADGTRLKSAGLYLIFAVGFAAYLVSGQGLTWYWILASIAVFGIFWAISQAEQAPEVRPAVLLLGDNSDLPSAIRRERSLLHSLPQLAKISAGQIRKVEPPAARTTGGTPCTGPSAARLAR